MPSHIALLRGINVVGNNLLPMADLRKLLASLGFANAQTLLQSGNVVFDVPGDRDLIDLEATLQQATERHCGCSPAYFIRTASQWKSIISHNPFPHEAEADPSHFVAMFFKERPSPKNLKALERAIRGRERFTARGRELYISYPDGIGKSKFTHTLIERTLACRGTIRNWNTVLKLAALASGKG